VKLDAIVKWLMPREERFHELLGRGTQNLLHGARTFAEIAEASDLEPRRVKVVDLKAIEHEGDTITRQIFEALNLTFITPLDREDIRSLAKDLDDILDHLEGVAQYLAIFELSEAPEGLRQFSRILVAMAESIDAATGMIWDVRNERRIHDAIVRISELENQADTLYNTVIADLFKKPYDQATVIMKWKVVYDGLEEACDSCKNYSHVLGNVLIKQA
jgi:predicted phosphate transport protein (TIGR00153 family)